jgi:hypothetical protein
MSAVTVSAVTCRDWSAAADASLIPQGAFSKLAESQLRDREDTARPVGPSLGRCGGARLARDRAGVLAAAGPEGGTSRPAGHADINSASGMVYLVHIQWGGAFQTAAIFFGEDS